MRTVNGVKLSKWLVMTMFNIFSNIIFRSCVFFGLWNYLTKFIDMRPVSFMQAIAISAGIWLFSVKIIWTPKAFKINYN